MAAGSHREPVCRPRISIALGRTRSARRVRAAGAAGNARQLVCGASFLCGSQRQAAGLVRMGARGCSRREGRRCTLDLDLAGTHSGLVCASVATAQSGDTGYHHHGVLQATGVPGDSLYQLELPLETAAGVTVPLSSLRGRPLLVTMFYSHCTSVCPLLTTELQQIERG